MFHNQIIRRALIVLLYLIAFIPLGLSPVEYDKFNTLHWHRQEAGWDAIFSMFSALGLIGSCFFLKPGRWRRALLSFGAYWFLTSAIPPLLGSMNPISKDDPEFGSLSPYFLFDLSHCSPSEIISGFGWLAWEYFTRLWIPAIIGIVISLIVAFSVRHLKANT